MHKSFRLSKDVRQTIKASMVAAFIENNPAPYDLPALAATIADSIHKHLFGKVNFKNIPPKMLNYSTDIKVHVTTPDSSVMSFKFSKRMPVEAETTYCNIVYPCPAFAEPLIIDYRDKAQKVSEHKATRTEFEEEITTILESVSTSKQLVELWPEAEQYIPAELANPSKVINLPALKTSILNQALGIKASSATAVVPTAPAKSVKKTTK